MDPSQWRYVAEGGENAIFEPTSPVSTQSLLRIRKSDLAISDRAARFLSKNRDKNDRDDAGDAGESDPRTSPTYLETVVAPLLAPYVDIPVAIRLEWSFVAELRRLAVETGRIPDARKCSWNAPPTAFVRWGGGGGGGGRRGSDGLSSAPAHHVQAQLVPDYRMLPLIQTTKNAPYSTVPSSAALSVELKPKAGYVAFSPLVRSQNRSKYLRSRFVLQQELMQLQRREIIRPGWCTGSERVRKSHFDPLDLFSGDAPRMRTAIRELFRCPQNNLKVTCNQQLLLSKRLDGSPAYNENAEALCSDILANLIGDQEQDSIDIRSVLTEHICNWLVGVFQQEDILQRLQPLQKLDIVDADGAIFIYRRLVELCNDSHEKAQSLLDDVATIAASGEKSPLGDSPFRWSQKAGDGTLPEICRKVKEFEIVLLKSAPKLPCKKVLDFHHEEVSKLIRTLDVTDCVHLLRNWLLSLMLSDISLFVTFRRIQFSRACDNHSAPLLDSPPMSNNGDNSCRSREAGILRLHRKMRDDVYLAYTVRVIDCDGKSSKKLQTRGKKEEPFGLLSIDDNKDYFL